MVSHNLRAFAYASLGLAFITFLIIFLITQNLESIDVGKTFSNISAAISINIIIWMVFVKSLWKKKLFYPWLVQVPNLSGDWEGYVVSSFTDDAVQIPISITIHQTFLNIQVRVNTDESRSFSLSASFDIDLGQGKQQLFYSYLNTPKPTVRDRSGIHYGSTLLIFDGFEVNEMEGEYWTSRETTGEIHMHRIL